MISFCGVGALAVFQKDLQPESNPDTKTEYESPRARSKKMFRREDHLLLTLLIVDNKKRENLALCE
jgi:hypothetical protein